MSAPEPQPWQMTKAEWDAEFTQTQCDWTGGQSRKYRGVAALNRQAFLKMGLHDQVRHGMQFPARHRDVVRHAVKQGLPVPDSVLAEYPDLVDLKRALEVNYTEALTALVRFQRDVRRDDAPQ